MKKTVCILLSLVLLLSGTLASAMNLDFLTDGTLLRYAANGTTTVELELSAELMEMLSENMDESALAPVADIGALLEDMASQAQTAKLAVKISDDFKRVEMSMEAQQVSDLTINPNLDITMRSRTGIWVDVDLTDNANPKCRVIYSMPNVSKYVVLDVFETPELFEDAQARAQAIELLDAIFSRASIQPLLERNRKLMEKYATIQENNRVYTFHFDNNGFCRYMGEMLAGFVDLFAMEGLLEPTQADELKLELLTKTAQLKLLGEDGYTVTYSLTGKRSVQKVAVDADFDISLNEVGEVLGDEFGTWTGENEGRFSLRIQQEMKMTLGGDSVYVTYPELTDENSISYAALYAINAVPEDETSEEFAEQVIYPYTIVGVDTKQILLRNGTYYLPLRATLDAAYETAYTLEYKEDGSMKIYSAWMDTVALKVGEQYAVVRGEQVPVEEIILYEGHTTYVSQRFFENVFGWRLQMVMHDLDVDAYYYSFFTE